MIQTELLNGRFKNDEAIMLMREFIQAKVKFIEKSIAADEHIEDLDVRERKISALQSQLEDFRRALRDSNGNVDLKVSFEWATT